MPGIMNKNLFDFYEMLSLDIPVRDDKEIEFVIIEQVNLVNCTKSFAE